MDVRNCRGCGRLFNYLSGPNICPECMDAIEKRFSAVRDFIRDNPSANISEVAKECDVNPNQIRQWVREERLQFSDDSPIGIECEKCGKTIKTGKYCKNCKETIACNLTEAFQRPVRRSREGQEGDRMFFNRK